MLFSDRVLEIIRSIPYGKVSTYGSIAILSGNPRAARQVSWILHSSSKKYNLPWHRVVNKQGKISLALGNGYEEQATLLESEGIRIDKNKSINLKKYGWNIQ